MKKIVLSAIIALILSVPAFADFTLNMKNGKAAYMAGNLETALKYYKAAFNENPTVQLGNFIVQLENKIQNANDAALPELESGVKQAAGRGITAASVLLGITDLALIGTAVYGYIDYNKSADDYDKLYTDIDNTNVTNYNRLVAEMNKVKGKETFMGVFAAFAGAAVLYTLADAFFIHAAFQKDTVLYFDPASGGIKLTLNREF